MPLLLMEMMVGENVPVKRMKIAFIIPGMDHAVEMTDVDVVLMAVEDGVPVSIEVHGSAVTKVAHSSCGGRL